MAEPIPTQIGDVLILYKDGSPIYVVGLVSADAQQTVNDDNQFHELGRPVAIETARSLVKQGRRIYLKNIDTGWWFGLK